MSSGRRTLEGVRRRARVLLGLAAVVLLIGVGAAVWLSYDARRAARGTRDDIDRLSSDLSSLQDSISGLDTGNSGTVSLDDLDSSISDVESEVSDLQSSVD